MNLLANENRKVLRMSCNSNQKRTLRAQHIDSILAYGVFVLLAIHKRKHLNISIRSVIGSCVRTSYSTHSPHRKATFRSFTCE